MVKNILVTRRSADEHKNVDIERAFNEETVPVLTYAPYISKAGHIGIGGPKDIPLEATTAETIKSRGWWFRCLRKRFSIADEVKPEAAVDNASQSSSDDEKESAEKLWPSTRLSKMAYLALVFNASNVLRFPYSCYQHGGSVFLLAYFTLVIIIIQPVIYLEMIVGQFSQAGVSGLSRFDIYSDGFTSILSIMCLVFVPYNEIELGFSGAYLLHSLQHELDNSENCGVSWNRLNSCVPYNLAENENLMNGSRKPNIWFNNGTVRTSLLSNELFFRQEILGQTWHGGDYKNKVNANIFLGLTMTYVLVFITIQGNLVSKIAQILICASTLVPASLLVLVVSQLLRPGAWDGIKFFIFDLKWEYMNSFDFWAEAIRHAFTSTGIGYGFYQSLSSRNPHTAGTFYSTSWMICCLDALFCTLSSLILFTELGIIKRTFEAESYYEIFAEKTGISFISLSGALLKLGHEWPAVCFFGIVNLFGIWQQTVATEICTAMLIWALPARLKRRTTGALFRRIMLILVIAVQVLWAVLLTHMWPYILDGFDLFGGTWAASIIILAEVIVTIYVYGFNLLMIDVEIMMDYSVPNIFRSQIKYIVPVVISVAVIVLTVDVCLNPTIYYLDIIKSPAWVIAIGILLNFIPIISLVFVGISASRRRKEAISHKNTGPKVDSHGKTRKFDMAYYRLLHRRPGIFAEILNEEESKIFQVKEKGVLNRRRDTQLKLKHRLKHTKRNKMAKANWQRIVNKVLLAEQRVNTVVNLIQFYIRECDRLKNIRESNYLGLVLEKFSVECIFLSAQMPDHGKPEEEYNKFLQGVLGCVTPVDLNLHYAPLTPFQLLVGKRVPTSEEEKIAMIVRIKKHMKLPFKRDELTLKRVVRQAEEKSHENSIFVEEAPHEFYVETSDHIILRIVVVKGADHSLLRSLPFPRPPEIKIPGYKIGGGTAIKTMHNITAAVEQDIQNKKPVGRPLKLSKDQPGRRQRYIAPKLPPKATVNESTYLYRPNMFPNWHFGAAVYPYGIVPERTYIVVLTNQYDVVRNNKFRWLKKRKFRKVWPEFSIQKNKQTRQTFGVTLAELFRYDELVAKHDEAMNAPADIIFRRPDANDDNDSVGGLSEASTHSSKSSSSESTVYEVDRYFSPPEIPVRPSIMVTSQEEYEEQEIFRRLAQLSTESSIVMLPGQSSPMLSLTYLNTPIERRVVSISPTVSIRMSTSDIRKKSNLTTPGTEKKSIGKSTPVRFSQSEHHPTRASSVIAKAQKNSQRDSGTLALPEIDRYSSMMLGAYSGGYTQSRLSLEQNLSRMNLRRNASMIKTRHLSMVKINRNIHHINQSEEEMAVKETLSLKAVWSQTSARGIQEGESVRAINKRAGRLRRAMAHWNDYDKYAYRSEGRTLTVEHKDDAQKRFVWAERDDSIASIEILADDSEEFYIGPKNKRMKLTKDYLS